MFWPILSWVVPVISIVFVIGATYIFLFKHELYGRPLWAKIFILSIVTAVLAFGIFDYLNNEIRYPPADPDYNSPSTQYP